MSAMGGCGGDMLEALNTRVYGNGTQTLVLSHGFGTDQSVWQYLIPALACYFQVVVFDLVFSPNVKFNLYDPLKYSNFDAYAQDLTCVLDTLHVNKTIFLGHSMSAMIGCIAAAKRPELFRHLLLLNGSPRYLNGEGYYGGLNDSDIKMVFNSIRYNYFAWIQDFAPKAIAVNKTEAISIFESTLARMKPMITLSVAKTVFLSDNRRVLARVHVPTTIIQSERDRIVPKSIAFYMKRKFGAKARVKILKTEGHFPQLTDVAPLLHVVKKVLHVKHIN